NMILGLEETTYQRYQDEEQRKMQMLDLLLRMDDRAFERYKDKREQVLTQYRDRYNAELDKWNARRTAISHAWRRTNELGYVDNESAIILGVAPGTLSKSAREQKEDAERRARERAEDYERTLKEIEYRHQLALELEDYRRQYSEEEGVTSRQLANY